MNRLGRLAPCSAGVLFLGAVLLTAGCGGSGKTRLRVMNAVPDQPNLQLLVDGTTSASSIAYGTSTGYQTISSGSRHIQLEAAGGSTVLIDQTISISSGTDTTLIAADFSFNAAGNAKAVVLTDDNSAPASGDFKLRLVNAAPSLGTVDVYVVAPGTNLQTVNATINDLGFEAASNYQSVAGGSYEISFTNPGQKFPAIDSGSQTFAAGQVRTFVGLTNSPFLALLQDVN